MSETIRPIKTKLGYLEGRDCIYLDKIIGNSYDVKFIGEIFERNSKVFIPYELTFDSVISLFSCELDTYYNLEYKRLLDKKESNISSFMVIENSEYLNKLPLREDYDKKEYIHYRLKTYDVVFDIIARSYEIIIKDENR